MGTGQGQENGRYNSLFFQKINWSNRVGSTETVVEFKSLSVEDRYICPVVKEKSAI